MQNLQKKRDILTEKRECGTALEKGKEIMLTPNGLQYDLQSEQWIRLAECKHILR